MGYRSDVTIALYPMHDDRDELWPLVKLWAQENWPNDWCNIEYRDGDTIVVINYEHVKWYSSYDFVQAVEAALEKFEETFDCSNPNHRAAYDFIRIGEETGDVETRFTDYTAYRVRVRCEAIVD